MTSPDPRREFLHALSGQLRCGPLAKRRVLRELAHHLDDAISDLQSSGLSVEAALDEALRRVGKASTIASGFAPRDRQRARRSVIRKLRSPAWIVVGAMSLVTAWAAELPQASGAAIPARSRASRLEHMGSGGRAPEERLRPGPAHAGQRRHRRA